MTKLQAAFYVYLGGFLVKLLSLWSAILALGGDFWIVIFAAFAWPLLAIDDLATVLQWLVGGAG